MFTLPDLPYAYNALEPFIDERTMQIHHDKHHAAYIKNLNDAFTLSSEGLTGHDDWLNMPVGEVVKNLHKLPEEIRTKVRNNAGGHANHTMFWLIMAPHAGGKPTGKLGEAIDTAFESFEKFQEKFSAAGMSRFGSGWAWLILENGALKIEDSPNQDSPLMEGRIPILGLDVWEHAYYLKYQNMRADYIKNWWNVVNWDMVAKWYAANT